jgi:hypothetical protein
MHHRAAESTSEPSEWALRDLAARVATFLYAIAANVSLRGEMQAAGYTPADHEEGQALLCGACNYRTTGYDRAEDTAARSAETALATWASRDLARYRAAVERVHPEHLALFAELEWQTPAEAILVVDRLLRRLSELPPRGAARAVLKVLERRGLTVSERSRLQELVHAAQLATVPGTLSPPAALGVGGEAPEIAAEVLALYRWYADWSVTARTVVRRKDWLERMGVVRRRKRGSRGFGDDAAHRSEGAPSAMHHR